MSKQRRIGQFGLLAVAIIWGNGFVASALALEYFTPYQILASRFTIAFLILCVIYIKKLKQLTKATIIKSSLLGIILYLAFLFQTIGLQYTTPSRNAFLTAVNVVIVPFLGLLFLRKRIPVKGLLGALVSFVGIGFISLDKTLTSFNQGDVLTLVCAVFFALHIFFTDVIVKEEEAWTITLVQMGSAALCSWVGLSLNLAPLPSITTQSVMPLLYLGIVSTLVAYFLQTYSQRYTTSAEAAIILSTEAFFGMLGSVIILSEPITFKMIVGAILIFLGILIVEAKLPLANFKKSKEGLDEKKEKSYH